MNQSRPEVKKKQFTKLVDQIYLEYFNPTKIIFKYYKNKNLILIFF